MKKSKSLVNIENRRWSVLFNHGKTDFKQGDVRIISPSHSPSTKRQRAVSFVTFELALPQTTIQYSKFTVQVFVS